jgi:ABC-type bacteriocin/lantibiotic exporter with double-glycine peptidase domain
MSCGHFLCASTPFFTQVIPEQQWPEGFRFAGEDRAYWSERTCGLACLMSIASFHGKPIPTIFELLREGVGLGHYTKMGWIHVGLAAIGGQYGFQGKALPAVTIDDLRSCLEFTGSPLIASVTRQFPEDGRRGGHLVVVTAIDDEPTPRICCLDPADGGLGEIRIPAARFFASFAGRIIVFLPTGIK